MQIRDKNMALYMKIIDKNNAIYTEIRINYKVRPLKDVHSFFLIK